jgi:hypothetical protein
MLERRVVRLWTAVTPTPAMFAAASGRCRVSERVNRGDRRGHLPFSHDSCCCAASTTGRRRHRLVMRVHVVGWVIVQGTRAAGVATLVDAATWMRSDAGERGINRWKTARMPKGVTASVWHGVQSAELSR